MTAAGRRSIRRCRTARAVLGARFAGGDRPARRSLSVAGGTDGRGRACERAGAQADDRQAICYQSRATPQKWIDPSTEAEIERAAKDRTAVLVVPIAFVSEHSETLVELDVEYRDLAERLGVPGYFRVPTQNSDAGIHCRPGGTGAADDRCRWGLVQRGRRSDLPGGFRRLCVRRQG